MRQLSLPRVTLCAATSINLAATLEALRQCMSQVRFGDAILFTNKLVDRLPDGLRCETIKSLANGADYSNFMLRELVHHVRTEYLLVVQWDGFILRPSEWQDTFLDFDYIGAVWPHFADGANVGNGGFSLRSRRLLEACMDARFSADHPEDVAICRSNRSLLENKLGIRFAGEDIARRFSFEREKAVCPTFGFHGVCNMPEAVGIDRFWQLYRTLDDPQNVFHDALSIGRALGPRRGLSLMRDYLKYKLGSRQSPNQAKSAGFSPIDAR